MDEYCPYCGAEIHCDGMATCRECGEICTEANVIRRDEEPDDIPIGDEDYDG